MTPEQRKKIRAMVGTYLLPDMYKEKFIELLDDNERLERELEEARERETKAKETAGEMLVCFADELDEYEILVDALPRHLSEHVEEYWDAGRAAQERRKAVRAAKGEKG